MADVRSSVGPVKRLDRLPRTQLLEGLLALGAVVTLVLPYALGTYTPIAVPRWWTPIAAIGVLLLVALWLLLAAHALADGWHLVYRRPRVEYLDPRVVVRAAFRIVETLGVAVPPYLVVYIGRQFGSGPETPHAPVGVGALFVVVGATVAIAFVVLLHAGWVLVADRPPNPS